MHVKTPTRISNASATIIDYYLCRILRLVNCFIKNPGLFNHECVIWNIVLNKFTKSPPHRGESYQNCKRCSQQCTDSDWITIINNDDPQSKIHQLLSNNLTAPFPLESWLTEEIRTAARNMRYLHQIRKYVANDNVEFLNYFMLISPEKIIILSL